MASSRTLDGFYGKSRSLWLTTARELIEMAVAGVAAQRSTPATDMLNGSRGGSGGAMGISPISVGFVGCNRPHEELPSSPLALHFRLR